MQKKILLMLLDLVSIFIMGFVAFFLVGEVIHYTPLLPLAAMSALYVITLSAFKFYRNRVVDSSLDVVKEASLAFGINTVAYIFVFGYFYGFMSTDVRWILVTASLSFLAVTGIRMAVRMSAEMRGRSQGANLPVAIIYGAGEMGSSMGRMASRGKFSYNVQGYIDDKKALQGEIVLGYPVLGTLDNLDFVLRTHRVDTLIIAISKISPAKIQKAATIAADNDVNLKIVPSLFEGKGRSDVSVRDLDYSDLLGRNLITIEKEPLFDMFQGKTVLVTGAGGSIGSEVCKQLMQYGLSRLVLLDIDETELHDLCLRLLDYEKEWSDNVVPVVCDIKNAGKIHRVFEEYRPDIVFHAAAYKHVPLMELYPEEAILTNICGSFNVFKSAADTGTDRVVVISTDKAVNPTNIMGATKRVVEMMAAEFDAYGKREDGNAAESGSPEAAGFGETGAVSPDDARHTEFCCVRFGNVIGSRGSMLPLFLEEIKAGRPITVTDRNIIRYFMAIPEAVSLVFRAATLARGGEVMVLDMGEPVKIYDFAQKLIDIFGDGRSQIKIIGLRPGEKLYEELLANKDNTIPTENEKIFKAVVNKNAAFNVSYMQEMVEKLPGMSREELVALLRRAVPEYKRRDD